MVGFTWHDMTDDRPARGVGNFLVLGVKGGLYLARRFEGYGNEVWFRDTRGNHLYPEQVKAWAQVPPYDEPGEKVDG